MRTKRVVFVLLVLCLLVFVQASAASLPAVPAAACTPGITYDPACDVNQDGDIDVIDIQLAAGHWGQTGTFTSGGWELTGNAGTVPGTNYVGTSDNVALQLHVRGLRALRLEPADRPGTGFTPNLIGGHPNNVVLSGTWGATISGGGTTSLVNIVSDNFGTVSGGQDNQAGDLAGTTADRSYATVGGGYQNKARGQSSTVGGGEGNQAVGLGATVPGGLLNYATADYSFAAGQNARALHSGSFVWSDASNLFTTFDSTQSNEMRLRVANGVSIVAASDSNYGLRVSNSGTGSLAAFLDGNIQVTGTCTGCLLAVYGINAGERALLMGDLVTIRGVAATSIENAVSLWRVAPAQPGEAIVGVVAGRAELDVREEPGSSETGRRLVAREGAARPGEYVAIIYSGPMQVKVARDESAVVAGTRLTAAGDGMARPLQTRTIDGMLVTEGVPVIGVALDAASGGMVRVLVNPQ